MNSIEIGISEKEVIEMDKINEYIRKKKFKKVVELSAKAKKKYPGQILFHISHSLGNTQLGNLTEALRILTDAEKIFPGDYELFFQTAKVYEEMDLPDEAEEYFMRSYEATPEDNYESRSDCMNDIGVLKYNQGKEAEADEYFEKALDINPENTKAMENILMLEEDYEDYEDEDYDDEEDSLYNEIEEDIFLFRDIQIGIYLKNLNRRKFKSMEEENKVEMHILAEWTKNIAGQMDRIKSLNKEEKTKWYSSVKIDFSGEPPEPEMPVINNPVYKAMAGKLDFLPPNGVSFVMLAFPFMEAIGISDDGFNDIMDKEELSDDEKSKLIWACKIGERIFKISDSESEQDFKNKICEILSIASQQLSEKKSEKVLWKVMDTMMGEM